MYIEQISLRTELFPTKSSYPFNLSFLNKTVEIDFKTPVTFFVGENGSGKSTLLRAITKACNIFIWENEDRSRPDFNPYERVLHQYIQVKWKDTPVTGSFFGSDIFSYFTEILDSWAAADPKQLDYFGGKSLTTLSHGQSLMAFFRNRYKIKGVYFLDEPETALSPRTQIELLNYINEVSKMGHAQFIIATHSPILLSLKGANIYNFTGKIIKRIKYRDTDHFKLYKDFILSQLP